ncbi:type III secretion system needle length determinant [Vibrio tubiashii]|uniref:Translocation protein in type III secretion n=1 Tax=Vibrio tubiashii ATCC 19109 TaxID=1051646 RepID=F9T7A4_9VIBR|nr:type III secretion system needle length determinant [Vibrio tubiashii]AIW14378.1 translocation protein in type III secretion [Vibrio tubiashii ATCC 19109]EGU53834.1 putative translocation protein in type III secretion [Vibrio tubiashii ATCC 19109]EIF03937.1 translocation protein in type III secretion [Vibrio tubiashii NCIMB 1337 = ATCC 19106]
MQIKQNIDGQTLNPSQKIHSGKALEQDPNRLQSRFENAMADKKQTKRKAEITNSSVPTGMDEAHLNSKSEKVYHLPSDIEVSIDSTNQSIKNASADGMQSEQTLNEFETKDARILQSHFEEVVTDKKQSNKKKTVDKDSAQTNAVESLPADKGKLSSNRGVELPLAQSNSQRQDSDLSPKDKKHKNPIEGSSASLGNSKSESNLSVLGRGASSTEVKEITFERLETPSTPKTETTQIQSSNVMTQGELILRSMTNQASQPTQHELSHLVKQLVEQIQVSLPNATTSKEVRLLLNDGQLKGGEIQIKLDNQGYSVTIRQDNALSVINQQARQELSERLNRLNLDQPIRITVTEQADQQHDQQHSRQQRSIYEEWQPEEN